MLKAFKKYITDNRLMNSEDKVLLAVSGGIDSMVMTHLFIQLGTEIGIAHCNFSLRAEESDSDADMVCKYASDHNIPFFTKRFETASYARMNGISVQMAARELRYSWFEEIRNNLNYDLIAVAHNLNDNIETMLLNLIRGTGITGLRGMRPAVNRIIRPLLFATRKDIESYGHQNNIIFREDKSNSDTKYTRNKLRHLVLPVLKEINPSIELTLSETAERFTGIDIIVSEYISGIREKVSGKEGDLITFNIGRLKTYLHNKTVIFELFKPFGITNVQVNDLLQIIVGKTGGQIFSNTHRMIKDRRVIIVSLLENKKDTFFSIISLQGFHSVPGISSAAFFKVTDKFEIPSDPSIACIDADKLVFPLVIRKWKTGDYFYPLGMKQRKKLSDYFIDRKYSIIEKEDILILESEGKIVWLMGDRLDNRFRITRTTSNGLMIKLQKKSLVIKPLSQD